MNKKKLVVMKKIVLFSFLMVCFAAMSQNNNLKHKVEKNFGAPGYWYDIQDAAFDYYYYEDASGNYVKHGNFKLSGERTYEKIVMRVKQITTDTYSATGKYKDGFLDGTLTIIRKMKSPEETFEWRLIAGYKDGLPDGEWKVLKNSQTFSVCHFKAGQMVGNVEISKSISKGQVALKGTLDEDGNYDGKWVYDDFFGENHQYEFIHGVLCRYIHRDKNGNVINKDEQDAQAIERIRDAATKLYNKEISEKDLSQMGFEFRYADLIRADNVMDEIYNSEAKYGLEKFGGQKTTKPNTDFIYFAPNDYMILSIQPVLPDKYMNALLVKANKYNDIINRPNAFSLHEVELATSMPELFKALYIDNEEIVFNKNCGIPLKPGTKNIKIYVTKRDSETDEYISDETYTFSQKQVDTINAIIEKLVEIYNEKLALYNYARTTISSEEKKLEKLSTKVYDQYLKNNKSYDNFGNIYKKEIVQERVKIIDNYITFEIKSRFIKDTLCPQIQKQVEGLSLKQDLEKYIKGIDYNIHDFDASSDVRRLYSTIINLKSYGDFAIKSRHIRDTLCPQIQKKAENLPLKTDLDAYINGIDYHVHDIKASSDFDRLDIYIKNLRSYDIMADLQIQYNSLNSQINEVIGKNKIIKNVYNNYISKSTLTNEITTENINKTNRIVFEMQTILNNLKSSDLNVLEKTLKSQKKEEETQIKTLIGDIDYNQVVNPVIEEDAGTKPIVEEETGNKPIIEEETDNNESSSEVDQVLDEYERSCNEWINMNETEREEEIDIIVKQRRYLEDLPDFTKKQSERYENINKRLKDAGFPDEE